MNKEFIKKIRTEKLLTQKEFAQMVGVSLFAVRMWEQGKRSPSLRHQRKILEFCKKHNINFDSMIGGK